MGVASNIWKLRLISSVRWFQLALPVLILFFQENDLSLFEAFMLQSIFSVVILCAELPTGYLGDRLGWRLSIIIGSFVTVGAAYLFMIAMQFWQFTLAEILMGLSYCFFSGSDNALLYETLVVMRAEQSFQKQEGSLLALTYMSEAVAAIIGAFIAFIYIRIPFIIEFIMFMFLIPLSFSLVKPAGHDSDCELVNPAVSKRRLREDFAYIIKFVGEHKMVGWVLLYSGFISFITLVVIWMMQVYFKLTNMPLYYLGIIWALLNIARSITAQWVCYFDYRLGTRTIFFIIPIIIALSLLVMGLHISIAMMLFGLLIQAMSGLKIPIVYTIINKAADSQLRAAVLSLDGMVCRLFFIIFFPLIGYLSETVSLNASFYVLSFLTALIGLLLCFMISSCYQDTKKIKRSDIIQYKL